METTKTMKVHPRTSVSHLLRVLMRARKNRREKACSASVNDLESKTSQVNGRFRATIEA